MADSNFPRLQLTLEEIRGWIRALQGFIDSHKELCNAHTVDFFTKEHWKVVVRDDWKDGLLQVEDTDCLVNPPLIEKRSRGSLQEFLHTASRLRLPVQPLQVSNNLLFGMTPKKSHEVGRASEFIASFTASQGVKQVLDVGSGKGYLSQHLSLQHGLTVVGMDSQSTHTDGALKRNKKVCKACKNKDTPSVKAKGAGTSTFMPSIAAASWDLQEDWTLNRLFDCEDDTSRQQAETEGTDPAEVDSVVFSAAEALPHKQVHCQYKSDRSDVDTCIESSQNPKLHPVAATKVQAPSYFPLTKEIGVLEGTDILHTAEMETSAAFMASRPCCLVGLHTCGDLAASCLRLFATLPTVQLVCVVGCCYHLISESCEEQGDVPGFPMSSYLKSINGGLGRTARMLACQTIYRIADITRGDALKVGMFRAVLQVLLMRKLAINVEDESSMQFIVGKQRRVPKSFEAYTRLASEKLEVDLSDVTDKQLQDLYTEHAGHLHELEKFFQLRAVIAPCIESLIVLDRLLYVWEQEPTKEAFLVQLFDPSLSPRCFGVVARKP